MKRFELHSEACDRPLAAEATCVLRLALGRLVPRHNDRQQLQFHQADTKNKPPEY
jgi:hypothetical protein